MGKRLVGAPAAVTCCSTLLLYRFCCNHHWFVQRGVAHMYRCQFVVVTKCSSSCNMV